MLDEMSRRRADHRPGTAIRLADGQCWTFPAPPDPGPEADATGGFESSYDALVRSVLEAEDCDEGRRCELALAICLLSHNYELDSFDLQGLLSFPANSPELSRIQEAFHALALEHIQALQARQPAAVPEARRGRVGSLLRNGLRFWTGRRAAGAIELASGPCP
jgi:hypothetical protein